MTDTISTGCAPSECGTKEACQGCSHHPQPQAQKPAPKIKKVIGVVSGKGGVGKSTVSASLAVALRRMGLAVGLMDADITGPSVPHLFGVHEKAFGDGEHIYPAQTSTGIRMMSINLLLENDEDPVVWRGPVLGGAVKQFWEDVAWGELDVLIIDMPPGTGDVPLTVYQSIPMDGIVVVTTPQDLVGMIVHKAVKMAAMLKIPVLGLIENMSYALCPDCGRRIEVFGPSHAQQQAQTLGVPLLAQLPIDPSRATLGDAGRIEEADLTAFEQPARLLRDLIG